MESEGIVPTVVEVCRRENAAAAMNETRNKKDEARRESTWLKVNPDCKKSAGVSPDGAGFSGAIVREIVPWPRRKAKKRR